MSQVHHLKRCFNLLLYIALLLVIGGAPLFASAARKMEKAPCEDVRLDRPGKWGKPIAGKPESEWPGSMQHVPVMSQGNVGFCYSYAAAQLFDAWRHSHQNGFAAETTTPIEAAIRSRKKGGIGGKIWGLGSGIISGNKYEGGAICPVAKHLVKYGGCSKESLYKYDQYGKRSYHEALVWLDQMKPKSGFRAIFRKRKIDSLHKEFGYGSCYEYQRKLLDMEEDIHNMAKVVGSVLHGKSDSSEDIMDGILKLCEGDRLKIDESPSCRTYQTMTANEGARKGARNRLKSSEKIARKVNFISGALNAKLAQPVGIEYCSNVIAKGKSWSASSFNPKCGAHASVIIGQRKNKSTGKCEFLLRNSWGKNTQNYVHKDWEDDEGNHWIDASHLMKNTFGVKYLGGK